MEVDPEAAEASVEVLEAASVAAVAPPAAGNMPSLGKSVFFEAWKLGKSVNFSASKIGKSVNTNCNIQSLSMLGVMDLKEIIISKIEGLLGAVGAVSEEVSDG